ncbi:hypothetical protein FQN50_008359 [Emmonsiellopsis sp. PD_5]|nr:hypothetical protein FQN50_008359 [Emmonsiellopsis sp. PD_5]
MGGDLLGDVDLLFQALQTWKMCFGIPSDAVTVLKYLISSQRLSALSNSYPNFREFNQDNTEACSRNDSTDDFILPVTEVAIPDIQTWDEASIAQATLFDDWPFLAANFGPLLQGSGNLSSATLGNEHCLPMAVLGPSQNTAMESPEELGKEPSYMTKLRWDSLPWLADSKEVLLRHENGGPMLPIICRKFSPDSADQTTVFWKDETGWKWIRTSAYGIEKPPDLNRYVDESASFYLETVSRGSSCLGQLFQLAKSCIKEPLIALMGFKYDFILSPNLIFSSTVVIQGRLSYYLRTFKLLDTTYTVEAMDNNWDTYEFNSADLLRKVSMVHICAYENRDNAGDEDGNPPTNHWAAFLQYGQAASVRLDMTPGYGSDGLRGKLYIASKPYVSTNKAIKSVSFPMLSVPTAQTITDLINQKGREKYNFTPAWEGCRFWIFTLISDLEAAGFLPAGSGQEVWGVLSQYWRYPTGSEPRAIAQGTFR